MNPADEATQRLAQERFLGRGPVVGVGVLEEDGPRVAFLLARPSATTRADIERWAHEYDVAITVEVVGENRPVSACS